MPAPLRTRPSFLSTAVLAARFLADRALGVVKLGIAIPDADGYYRTTSASTWPTYTAGTAAPDAAEPVGSTYQRTSGVIGTYANTDGTASGWVLDPSQSGELKLGDAKNLYFGADLDVAAQWTGTKLTVLPIADDTGIEIGNGTLSCDLKLFGNIATAYLNFDASANLLELRGPMRTRGFNAMPTRKELFWNAGVRGKPAINADIQDASEAVRMIADPDFEVLGTNADTTCVTHYAEGGIALATKTTSADQVIILPHLDTSQSGWKQITWGTDQETEWECDIATASAITSETIWAGLKLTNTSVTATDNDQAFFRYQNGVNSGKWQACYSIGGTDTETDAGVTVALSTRYHLKVAIDSSRIARFYIDGVLVATSTALTDATDLIPYIGIQTGTTAAKTLYVYGQAISRKLS